MSRLLNKVAVITGGNSGIGKGIAERFIQEGAKVVIFGRNQQTLEQTQKELGSHCLCVQGDVTNMVDIKRVFQETEKTWGKVDTLVVNSGVVARIALEEATEEEFDRMINTNYRGAFFTVHHSLKHLNNKASIILISSTAAAATFKAHSIYSTTKAAVTKMAKNFALDLADLEIRVNSISPGYIKTPIFDKTLKQHPDFLKQKEKYIPLNRIGSPQDIANAALFLASDEASYITGTDLLVDGGYAVASVEKLV